MTRLACVKTLGRKPHKCDAVYKAGEGEFWMKKLGITRDLRSKSLPLRLASKFYLVVQCLFPPKKVDSSTSRDTPDTAFEVD